MEAGVPHTRGDRGTWGNLQKKGRDLQPGRDLGTELGTLGARGNPDVPRVVVRWG